MTVPPQCTRAGIALELSPEVRWQILSSGSIPISDSNVRVHVTVCGIALTYSGRLQREANPAVPRSTSTSTHVQPNPSVSASILTRRNGVDAGARGSDSVSGAVMRGCVPSSEPLQRGGGAAADAIRWMERKERGTRWWAKRQASGASLRDFRGESHEDGAWVPVRGATRVARTRRRSRRAEPPREGLDEWWRDCGDAAVGGLGLRNGDHSGSRTSEMREKHGTLAWVSGLSEARRHAHRQGLFVFELRLPKPLRTRVRVRVPKCQQVLEVRRSWGFHCDR